MFKKKCISFLLTMLMVVGTVVFSAGTAAKAESAMTVASNESELAVKTGFSADQDHVQRIGNLFKSLNDPARTSNNPVDFGQTYLVPKNDMDIWNIRTRITGDTQATQDEATPFMINGSYIGANHGQNSGMYVTAAAHGLSYADVGSQWTTLAASEGSDPIIWNLLRIVDENTLLFLSNGTYQSGAYTYGFSKQLKEADTMSRVGGEGSLTVGKVMVNQVFPSIRHTKKAAYAVSGGLKWKIEPNNVYACDYVIIEESYQIIDPSTIADAIRANAPSGGYTANPDLTFGGEPMMNYNVVYTLLPDGTVLTEVNHEVLKTVRIDSYGLLQYPKRADYAGGGIYRYLPNTKDFQARAINQTSGDTNFNFSVPTKIIGTNASAYPNSYTYLNKDCVDPSYPNERMIDFFSNGSKDAAAFASGYLPVGMGEKDKMSSSGFYFYNSYKAYPRIYQSVLHDEPGTILSGVGYKKLYAGGRSDDVNAYTVPYGDTLYTYVDMFANGKSYTLPQNYEVVNKSANVTINEGVATAAFAAGDTHGYIVVSSANTTEKSSVTAAGVLAQLTKESISSEPLDFVTKDLVFPEMSADSGVTLTWESSNENVVAVNGAVTRPELAVETVTLKAVATDKSGSQEKSFTVKVAPLTVKEISTNESFASGLSGWSSSNVEGAIVGDADNHYASFVGSKSFAATTISLTPLTSLGGTGTYTVEYKLQLPSTTTAGEIVRVDLKANNKVISSIALTPGKLMIVAKGQTWYSANSGASNGSYTIGNWAEFKTIIDPIHNTRRIFYNGSELTLSDNSFWNSNASNTTTLGANPTTLGMDITFRNSGTGNTPILTAMLDDLKVYTEDTPESYVQSLSDAEKAAWAAGLIRNSALTEENHIAVTKDLNLDAGYSAFNLEACGISVEWVSDDPAIISNEGKVTGGLGAKTVTMTANITAGTAHDTVSIPFIVVQPSTTAIGNATYAVNDFEGEESTRPLISTNQLNGGTIEYVKDKDAVHGNVLKLTNTGNGAAYSVSDRIYNLPFHQRYFVNFDMKYERMAAQTDTSAFGSVELLGVKGSTAGSVSLRFDSREVGLYTSLVRSDGTTENAEIRYRMPDSVREGQWITVTYDYNLVSRTYQVYINGELINEMPLLKANIAVSDTVHALRGFKLGASRSGSVSMDNLTIRQSDAKAAMANGGLNAALITYASADQRNALTARETLMSTGPSTAQNFEKTDYAGNPGMYQFRGGAALTYQLDGSTVTAVSPAGPTDGKLTISSTYQGVTETKTVQRRLAPVSIDSITAGETITKVTLSGTLPTGGKVVVAAYTNNGTVLKEAKMFDAALVLAPDMSTIGVDAIKVFVLNNAVDLRPIAFALQR